MGGPGKWPNCFRNPDAEEFQEALVPLMAEEERKAKPEKEVQMAGEIRASVNGLQTLSGGTRTSVKIDRPWQPKMVFPTPNPCPFCTKKQED